MAAKKPPAAVAFTVRATDPDLVKAAAVALGITQHCKADSWAQLVERLDGGDPLTLLQIASVHIPADVASLIDRYDAQGVLRLLTVKPMLTLAVCPVCERWTLVGSGPAPTRCKVTWNCTGFGPLKPVKASKASKYAPTDEEIAEIAASYEEAPDGDDLNAERVAAQVPA